MAEDISARKGYLDELGLGSDDDEEEFEDEQQAAKAIAPTPSAPASGKDSAVAMDVDGDGGKGNEEETEGAGEGDTQPSTIDRNRTNALASLGLSDGEDDDQAQRPQDGMDEAQATTRGQHAAAAAAPETIEVPYVPRPESHLQVLQTTLSSVLGVKLREYRRTHVNVEAEQSEAPVFIRWRFRRNADGRIARDADDKPIMESNTRLVKWPDGTMQLVVGSVRFNCDMPVVKDRFLLAQHTVGRGDAKKTILEPLGSVHHKVRLIPEEPNLHGRRGRFMGVSKGKGMIKKHESHMDPTKEAELKMRSRGEMDRLENRKRRRAGQGPRMARDYLEDDNMGQYDQTNVRSLKESIRAGGARGRAPQRRGYQEESEDSESDFISDSEVEDAPTSMAEQRRRMVSERQRRSGSGRSKEQAGDAGAGRAGAQQEDEEDEDDVQVVRKRRAVESGGGGADDDDGNAESGGASQEADNDADE